MKDKVRDYILKQKMFRPGDRVLLGFSGGADSLCLLLLLRELSPELEIRISACHVHHGLRGETADRDERFSRKICEELDIPFFSVHVDAGTYARERGCSPEEAARILRYQAFEQTADREGMDRVALAHHRDDQAETVIFQLLRGSGLRGLSGIPPLRDRYVRPLLNTGRREIREYLLERGLSWCEDETNAADDATRNRIRHHVLPELSALRPDAAEKLADTADYLRGMDDYIRGESNRWIEAYVSDNVIPAEAFSALHPVLREYVIAEMMRRSGIPMKDVGRKHIDDVAALAEKQVGRRVILRGGQALRTYTGIRMETEERTCSETAGGPGAPAMEIRVFPRKTDMEIPRKEYTKWFSYDKIDKPLCLRHREPGDLFSTVSGSHKKLKDYLIDEKIPREERDRLWLVASGQEILWIPGLRMSEDHKVTEETEEILEITFPEALEVPDTAERMIEGESKDER